MLAVDFTVSFFLSSYASAPLAVAPADEPGTTTAVVSYTADERGETRMSSQDAQLLQHRFDAAYTALLLGFVVLQSAALRQRVSSQLPDGSFAVLRGVLEELVLVQSSASMLTQDSLDAVVTVIAVLKNHDEAAAAP